MLHPTLMAIAVQILGYVSGTMTTLASVPQIIRSIRTRSTTDISYYSLALTTVGGLLWSVYGVFVKDIPIIVFDIIIFVLYVTLIGIKMRNDRYSHSLLAGTILSDAPMRP